MRIALIPSASSSFSANSLFEVPATDVNPETQAHGLRMLNLGILQNGCPVYPSNMRSTRVSTHLVTYASGFGDGAVLSNGYFFEVEISDGGLSEAFLFSEDNAWKSVVRSLRWSLENNACDNLSRVLIPTEKSTNLEKVPCSSNCSGDIKDFAWNSHLITEKLEVNSCEIWIAAGASTWTRRFRKGGEPDFYPFLEMSMPGIHKRSFALVRLLTCFDERLILKLLLSKETTVFM